MDGETEREVVETDITLPDDRMIDLMKSKHHTRGDIEEERPSKRVRNEGVLKFDLSEGRGKKLVRLLGRGISNSEAKNVRPRYVPNCHRSFKLQVPSLDDSLYQRLM